MMKFLGIFIIALLIHSAYSQNPDQMMHKFTNDLIHESSPYLLQHSHNPVDWEAWRPDVLQRAKNENRLIVISIGYAACHWCHVMEEECFEDEEVAATMNEHFVNIKIDREERPDIDQIYMDALQMMSGHGGWPLNIVALPDGRPFWGATYVKKNQWIRVLEQIADLFRKDAEKIEKYATELAAGIKQINLIDNEAASDLLSADELKAIVTRWYRYFDTEKGGYNRAPKFMMPGNLDFLLHYYSATTDEEIKEYVDLTLSKMAYGGVFDQLGGGFARYSVDTKWHVPHFEKMLYDNGLLVSLYSKAYGHNGNELYAEVVQKTISFLTSELMDANGGFYSSLDADSDTVDGELEEGAFYVWTEDELSSILGDPFELFQDYYNINDYGHWEKGNYVLIRDKSDAEVAEKHKLEKEELKQTIEECQTLLLKAREKRPRPRLDDKILCSWNGLMLKGLTDAYRYLGKKEYLDLAINNAEFLEQNFIKPDGTLWHNHKAGKSSISGYLEDYAALIEGFIGLYEVSFEEKWLLKAKELVETCILDYYDEDSGLFFFSSTKEDFLIRRTLETTDNVIPASNSILCKNLMRLSALFMEPAYEDLAVKMVSRMQERIVQNPESHANWLHVFLYIQMPYYEVAIVGDNYLKTKTRMERNYLPNSVFAGASIGGTLDLFSNRYKKGQTLIYICEKGSCQAPLETAEEAVKILQAKK